MLFLLYFFIIEVSCNFFYMNNLVGPVKSSPQILDGLFYDHNQAASAESDSNFDFFQVPRTPSSVGDPYDIQARKLLNFYDANVKKIIIPQNENSIVTYPRLISKTSKPHFETTSKIKPLDFFTTITTTAQTETSSSSTESTTSLATTTIENLIKTSSEKTILDLENINFVSSTTDQIILAKTVNKKLFVNSIIKDINETFKLDFEKNYKKEDFDCLTCRKIVDKNDCYIYSQFDSFDLINTFCCQCNNNK